MYAIKKCMRFGTDLNRLQESVSTPMKGKRPMSFTDRCTAEAVLSKLYRKTLHGNGFPCGIPEIKDALAGRSALALTNAGGDTAKLSGDGRLIIITSYGFYKEVWYEIA